MHARLRLATVLAAVAICFDVASAGDEPAAPAGLDISVFTIDTYKPEECSATRLPAEPELFAKTEGPHWRALAVHDVVPVRNGRVVADLAVSLGSVRVLYVGVRARVGASAFEPIQVTWQEFNDPAVETPWTVPVGEGVPWWYTAFSETQCLLLRFAPSARAAADVREVAPGVLRDGRFDTRIKPAKVQARAEPQYPATARIAHRHGDVRLNRVVDTSGRVVYARVISYPSGAEDLALAALGALVRWRYEPARRGKEPVADSLATLLRFAPETDAGEPVAGAVPAAAVSAEFPPPLTAVRPPTVPRFRFYSVARDAAAGAAWESCRTPVTPPEPGLDRAAIAHAFGGSSATTWSPDLGTPGHDDDLDGILRVGTSRVLVGIGAEFHPDGRWIAAARLDDLGTRALVANERVTLEPGGDAWFARPVGDRCLVVHVDVVARSRRVPGGLSEDGPREVRGDVTPPSVDRRVAPLYPEAARHEGRTGKVISLAVIGADGFVSSVRTYDFPPGSEDLALSALDAVSQWRYKPALVGGTPVTVNFVAQVTFKLE